MALHLVLQVENCVSVSALDPHHVGEDDEVEDGSDGKADGVEHEEDLQRWLLPGDKAGGVSAQDLAIGDTEEANANEWHSPGNGVVN